MTLNLFFVSVTIKKRVQSLKDAANNEIAEKLYDQNKDRQISMYRVM